MLSMFDQKVAACHFLPGLLPDVSHVPVCLSAFLYSSVCILKKYFMSLCGQVPCSVKRDPLDQGLTEQNKNCK